MFGWFKRKQKQARQVTAATAERRAPRSTAAAATVGDSEVYVDTLATVVAADTPVPNAAPMFQSAKPEPTHHHHHGHGHGHGHHHDSGGGVNHGHSSHDSGSSGSSSGDSGGGGGDGGGGGGGD